MWLQIRLFAGKTQAESAPAEKLLAAGPGCGYGGRKEKIMILSLLLTTLFFALLSQAVSYCFRRRAPQESGAIAAAGLSSSVPILASVLLVAAYGVWLPMNPDEQMGFIWKGVSVISLATMFGVLISGDAGRWERTDDEGRAGVKRVRTLSWGSVRRPFVPKTVLFAPKPQSVPVRRARQVMGFIGILFAMNALAVFANHAEGKRPTLAATPFVLKPSTLSTIIVERLEEPRPAERVLVPARQEPQRAPGVLI